MLPVMMEIWLYWFGLCECVAGVTSLEMSCSELKTGKIPSGLIDRTHFIVCCQCEIFRCLASVSLAVLIALSMLKLLPCHTYPFAKLNLVD